MKNDGKVPPEIRAQHDQRATERAQAELAAGCLQCGQPWKVHFKRGGEYRGCKA